MGLSPSMPMMNRTIVELPVKAINRANQKGSSAKLELYIWRARNQNIGHVSLFVPENCLYVSFWPDESVDASNALDSVNARHQEYDQDVIEEGFEPEIIYSEMVLDLSSMEKCWKSIKENNRYSLAMFNCADAVISVLSAGSRHFASISSKFGLANSLVNYQQNMLELILESGLGGREPMKIAREIQIFKDKGLFSAITRYKR